MNERHRAERFAALLDARAAGRGEGAHAAGRGFTDRGFTDRGGARRAAAPAGDEGGLGVLVALAERVEVAAAGLPAPEADFRAALRARLVAEAPSAVAPAASGAAARTAGQPAPSRRAEAAVPGRRSGRGARSGARHSGQGRAGVFTGISAAWRRRLLAAGVGVAVATGSVGGIAIASAGAVPGDPLYSAKKIFENLQLSLSGSPTDQGREYLRLADVRLGEIDALLGRPDVDLPGSPTQAYLGQTLAELRSMISTGGDLLIGQVRAAGDQTALHALADFLLTERQRVADLSWRLPPSMQSQPPQIVALMDQLSRQLQQAAEQAARGGQSQPGTGSGVQGGSGAQSQGGAGNQGTSRASSPAGASPTAGTGHTGGASGSPSAGGSGSSGSPSSGSPNPGSTIGVGVTVPAVPSIGVTLPGLLGLPQIDLGLGADDENPGSTPTP